jgi:hypothetical protein
MGLHRLPRWDSPSIPPRRPDTTRLTEFEISYGEGNIELDVQVRGTVPTSTSGKILVTKIEHLQEQT